MYSKKCGNTWAVRLEIGEEVLESIASLCKKENIHCAEISGIGAASNAVTGIYNIEEKKYCRKEYRELMEIVSLLGSVTQKDGEPYLHIHALFAGNSCGLVGGHLISATVGITAEIFLREIDGEIGRTAHPVTGINVLDI